MTKNLKNKRISPDEFSQIPSHLPYKYLNLKLLLTSTGSSYKYPAKYQLQVYQQDSTGSKT